MPEEGGSEPANAPDCASELSAGGTWDVFVSYASQDSPVAKALCASLERGGVKCWIAPRDVTPGTLYADAIVRAITHAKVLVVVLSAHSVASSHVGKEVERASSKRRPIIGLRVDTTSLTPALEYFLSESQWIDASASGTESALPDLLHAVRHLTRTATPAVSGPIEFASVPVRADASKSSEQPPAQSFGRRHQFSLGSRTAIWLIAVMALLGALFVGSKFLGTWQLKTYQAAVSSGPPATSPGAAVSPKSIAVLPFTDMSEKKDQEYFADGMAEEILDLLAKIPSLTVIGRTSSFQFKGKNGDLRKIGTELNAAHVLEGSVRRSGDQVRITAQLISTHTGAHEWSETYDRPIGDVLKLQDAIAAAVARQLQLTMTSGDRKTHSALNNTDAYDLMLRGRYSLDRSDKEGYDEAVTLFKRVLDLDPKFADALGDLAWAYLGQAELGSMALAAAGFEQARRAATNALQLDPNNVAAHAIMAWIHIQYDWDWAGAEREFQRAATLAPGNADVLSGEALLSEILGRSDDALKQCQAALAQDPLNAYVLVTLADIQESRGKLREAETALRRALEIRPTYAYGHQFLGLIFLERGDRDGALREMQQEPDDAAKRQGLEIIYYALGRKRDSDAALASMLHEDAEGDPLGIARAYAYRGRIDDAMHWLERAYAQKDLSLYAIKAAQRNPLLKNLAADPRYKALLRKMNLPES